MNYEREGGEDLELSKTQTGWDFTRCGTTQHTGGGWTSRGIYGVVMLSLSLKIIT
jgi:hypothetical protein